MSEPLGQLLEDFYNNNFNGEGKFTLPNLTCPYLTSPELPFLDLNISSNLIEGEDIENFSDLDTMSL